MTESREFRKLGAVVSRSLRILTLAFFMAPAPGFAATPEEARTFEAITGESAGDDHTAWDSFYKKKDHAFGRDAIGFLKEQLPGLKRGEAFVPAMGEGRNALYLANNGFKVVGVDLSAVAVDRAIAEARSRKLPLRGVVADLFQYSYPKEKFDLVVLSLFYAPELLGRFKGALKKGGQILIYLKLDNGRPGGTSAPDEFAVKPAELKAALNGFEILTYREFRDQSVDVVGVLARKP